MAPLEVRGQEDPEWLEFLAGQPDATFFHHPVWSRVLAETYGYGPLVLIQTGEDGQIIAGLPVLDVHPILSRRRLVSLPFTDYCPPLATTPAALADLSDNLVQWRKSTRVPRMTIHGALAASAGIHPAARGVRHTLSLDPGPERLFASLKGKVQWSIRKAQRVGVRAGVSHSPSDLAAFYELHVQTRRRLGVPVQPRRFLENVWKQVVETGMGFAVFAYHGERPIAAAVFLAWNHHLIYKYSASDPEYWTLRPNDLIMWTAIDWGCHEGYRTLDFGRSDLEDEGLRVFKSRWGATEIPLVYSYLAASPPGPASRVAPQALATIIRWAPPIVCRAMGEFLYRRVPAIAG